MTSHPRRGTVRQHSLQQPPRRLHQTRRQRSAEEEKVTRESEKSVSERPKVRIAWGDETRLEEARVEVVACQIATGKSSARQPRMRTLASDKTCSTLLYSRQELAERLRLAWKQREANKSNIDVFLAQGTTEERSDSRLSSSSSVERSPVRPDNEIELEDEEKSRNFKNNKQNVKARPRSPLLTVRNGEKSGINENNQINLKYTSRRISEISRSLNPAREDDKIQITENNEMSMKNLQKFSETPGSFVPPKNEEKFEIDQTDRMSLINKSPKMSESPTLSAFAGDEGIKSGVSKDESSENAAVEISESVGPFVTKNEEIEFNNDKINTIIASGNILEMSARSTVLTRIGERSEINENNEITSTNSSRKISEPLRSVSARNEERSEIIENNRSIGKIMSRKTTESMRSPLVPPRMENAISRIYGQEAKSKRASFKSGSNAAFSNPVDDASEVVTPEVRRESYLNTIESRNRRTCSAPPQRRANSVGATSRTQVNIVIEAPVIPKTEEETNFPEAKVALRPVKSAPTKRRVKPGKRRSNSVGKDLDGRAKISSSDKNCEVITMVSLVSDADSDSEVEEYSPRDDKLISQLRSNLPTTPIIKTNVASSPLNAIARRPIKSVSFQQDSFDLEDVERGNTRIRPQSVQVGRVTGSALPTPEEARTWRTEVTSLTITNVSGRQHYDNQGITEISLTDREKRCLIVPIGDPRSDKKRKLFRTRSTPQPKVNGVEKDVPSQQTDFKENSTRTRVVENLEKFLPVQQATSILLQASVSKLTESAVMARSEPELDGDLVEPAFQTTKEKECWHLYRRMCDKGVCVSFDTVLRGMLTPTEYRLRRKEMT